MENVNDLIFITDENFNHEYINEDVYKKILGYSKDDLIGKSGIGFIHPEDIKSVTEAMEQVFKTGEGIGEARVRRKNGSYLWVELNGRSFVDKDGKQRLLGIVRDISERKALEEKREKYLQKLESELRIKTEELVQSEKLATIGLLAAGIAHEINNPIMGMLNYAYIVKNALEEKNIDTSSEPYSFLNGFIRETSRIAKIVEDILKFVRKDSKDYIYGDILDVINFSLFLLSPKFKEYQIDLQLDFQENIPKIPMRSGSIQQVILNTLQNSIDALNEKFGKKSSKGLKRISIVAALTSKNKKKYLKISIRDNGQGIQRKNLKKIFSPFFTTKSHSKEHGTGLGLSISKGIIESHGGEIKINSHWKKNTTVEILLALTEVKE